MKHRLILLSAVAAVAVGCVPYSMTRSPELSKPLRLPDPSESPAIRLTVSDETGHPKKVAQALDFAKKKLPYLSAASNAVVDSDYTIVLSVSFYREDSLTELSGATMALIPSLWWKEVDAVAMVKDSEDNVLGVFESRRKSKYFAQMHMMYILPVIAPLACAKDRKLWNATVRDALFQAGQAIAMDRGGDPDVASISGRVPGGAS